MTNNKIILGFVGDLAAGKGTVCAYLHEKYGAATYKFSTMLRDVVKRLYIDVTRENLQKISTVLRQNFGEDLMSRAIAQDVMHDKRSVIAVDGIRRPSDISFLKDLPGFHLVYITADPKIRWERLVTRNENEGDDKKTFEEFLKDEQAESDKHIKDLGATATVTINNDGTLDDLYTQIDGIITKLQHEN